ncbi:hypothetical protein H0N95_01575 [Candidatus Micrarchaeota archaeon]|nr:hypothetical protein [Candidatus Micrarchaeota archaeon]
MNNYKKGYALEHKTKQLLEKNGWLAMRSPASKTPIDLMATKDGSTVIIQCKKTTASDSMSITELGPFVDLAKKHKALALLAYSFNGTPVYAKKVDCDRVAVKRIDKHVELEKFLKIRDIQTDDNMIITGE